MTSRRRTFHVDWDSPSHETGTVKRRPVSIGLSFPCAKKHFKSVEYYGDGNPGNMKSVSVTDSYSKYNFGTSEGDDFVAQEDGRIEKKRDKEKTLVECEADERRGTIKGMKWVDVNASLVKTGTRTVFDLKSFSGKTIESRSKSSNIRNIARTRGISSRTSLIPKPKTTKASSVYRGLANSSSDSSGIGSPLSPLSPLSPRRDSSIDLKEIPKNIKFSESNSSGLGSCDSFLSPECQIYMAFYLIEQQQQQQQQQKQQLEKSRMPCTCKIRQVQISRETRIEEKAEKALLPTYVLTRIALGSMSLDESHKSSEAKIIPTRFYTTNCEIDIPT
ncbi:hypothetical protein HZH68_003775 [Vespula germanica]|uniref:Uncharacterized protein n=1 Tax=Vespula germanica TaxID=30212 RepID=A0A834U3N4_VESGE|nr:hypothetical protein HZH68_003775 [Vespula germanica]